ncbi:hypothetical protein RZO55_14060, partial [Clostridium boliviensis]|nr:hypothetical protein [Clostridium boliviensis]
ILLIDSSKFGVRSFTRIVGLDAIDILITDDEADADVVEAVRRFVPQVQLVNTMSQSPDR